MADLDEAFVLGFIDFLRSDATDVNSDATVAKYVDRLKVIYREYCGQYRIHFKKRIFERLDVDTTKRPDIVPGLRSINFSIIALAIFLLFEFSARGLNIIFRMRFIIN